MVDAALARAADFVRRAGSPAELARLAYLLGEKPDEAQVAALLAGQRADGGFPPSWSPDYSSIDGTCFRLAQAEQAGLSPSRPELSPAMAFLARRQRRDGSWAEDVAQAAVAPPWAQPGQAMSEIYLTANAGSWVMRGGDLHAARKASQVLRSRLDADGTLPSFLHANWLAAGLFWGMGDRPAAEKLLQHLLRRVSDISASGLAWMVVSLLGCGVDPRHALVAEARSAMLLCQRDDGAFPSEDGPDDDVYATLEAVHALRAPR